MRKFFKIGIALFAAIAILGIISCSEPSSSPKPKPPVTGSDVATLTSVRFGNENATLGTPAASYGSATAGSVTILQAAVTVTATPTDAQATVEYAQVAEGEALNEADFWPDSQFTFATGDALAIKVTAQNGTTKLYYKIGVTLNDVALETLTVGTTAVAPLPNPGTSWETAVAGSILFSYPAKEQPAGGLAVVAVAKSTDATVQYARVTGDGEPTFSESSTITFADWDFLYVKVTGSSGSAYYKVQINFQQEGTIKYGRQEFNPDHSQPADLSVWDDSSLQIYNISKIYANDSGQLLDPNNGYLDADNNPKTKAWAKALWDEAGLYIYLDVIDDDMSAVDNEHESDSFELFVNEGPLGPNGKGVYANSNPIGGGSQYRLALNGQVSGEGGSPDAMKALNDWSVWKKADDSGYIMVLHAPWRLRNKFFSPTTYRNDWEFGFELQLNVAGVTGNRYGVLVWNNISHTNYQNAEDYGRATLKGQTGPLNYPAVDPIITTQPQGNIVEVGESVTLSVTTTVPVDGGTISYEWFMADAADGTFSSVSTANPYTFVFSNTKYYYAAVTNTVGSKTATIKTATVGIIDAATINMPEGWVEKIVAPNTCAPVYGFKLPAGDTFGDYYRLRFKIKFDANSEKKNGRTRAWGSYSLGDWDPSTSLTNTSGMANAQAAGANANGSGNTGLLLSTASNTDYTADWQDKTIEFTEFDRKLTDDGGLLDPDAGAGGIANLAAIKAKDGTLLIAFAPIPNFDGGTRTYYLTGITLENADGSKVISALHPDHPLLWGGTGGKIYVSQDPGNDKLSRTLYDWVDKISTVNGNAVAPVWAFNLPTGKKFSDYTKIKVELAMTNEGNSTTGRLRAWGTYDFTDWADPAKDPKSNNMKNTANNGLLSTGTGSGAATYDPDDGYKPYTILLNDLPNNPDATKNATGTILLAVGLIGTGDVATNTRVYNIRNITLENDEGTSVVKVMIPDSSLLWGGNGKAVFVSGNGNDGSLTRGLREIAYDTDF